MPRVTSTTPQAANVMASLMDIPTTGPTKLKAKHSAKAPIWGVLFNPETIGAGTDGLSM